MTWAGLRPLSEPSGVTVNRAIKVHPPDDGGSPIDHYDLRVEPGALQYRVDGNATGAELRGAVPAGPIAVTVQAVNAVGAADPTSMAMSIPIEAAATPVAPATIAEIRSQVEPNPVGPALAPSSRPSATGTSTSTSAKRRQAKLASTVRSSSARRKPARRK